MHGKNPTKKQATLISSMHLEYKDWLVIRDLPNELHIKHRLSDSVKIIPKRTARP